MAKRNQRRLGNVLINARYQLKYALLIVIVGLSFAVGSAVAFREYVKVNYQVLTHTTAITEEIEQIYVKELRRFTDTILILSAAFLVVLALWMLYITHRSAGPMYHFKRVFEAIKRGQRDQRIRLRPHDEFQDVAAAFNAMMDKLSEPQRESAA